MAIDDPLFPLLDAAREGNDTALAELVRQTQPMVWRLCESLGSPDEPADLAQETYLRMLRSMHGFRGDAPVLAWLLSIARHTCADAVRSTQRRRRLLQRVSDHTDRRDVAPTDLSIDDLLDRLHPDRREVFVLTQKLGLSYDEAAVVLDCPIGTVRSRLARARADLLDAVRAAESA